MLVNLFQVTFVILALPLAYGLPASILDLTPRAIQSAIQGLPACNSKSTDPSWAVGVSAWQDGQGHNIGNDCDNGQGGHSHCWTDYFLVGTTASYNNWYQAIGNIQCDGDCHEDVANLAQSCTTTEWSVSQSIGAGFDLAGVGISSTTTVTVGESRQICNIKSDTSSCRWTDQACHSVWAAEQISTVHGYKRRTCKSPSGKSGINMPNTPVRADGYYTRGMQDFEVKLPSLSAIDCTGTCDPIWSPGQLPPLDSSLKPVPGQ